MALFSTNLTLVISSFLVMFVVMDSFFHTFFRPSIQFYKMLSAGVPEEAVKQTMWAEGFNRDELDVDLFRSVQIQSKKTVVKYEEGEDVEPCYQKVRWVSYARHWFRSLVYLLPLFLVDIFCRLLFFPSHKHNACFAIANRCSAYYSIS